MKLWESVMERRIRMEVTSSEQQYGFLLSKSATDALFALRVLMEKHREGQKEMHFVSMELGQPMAGCKERRCGIA